MLKPSNFSFFLSPHSWVNSSDRFFPCFFTWTRVVFGTIVARMSEMRWKSPADRRSISLRTLVTFPPSALRLVPVSGSCMSRSLAGSIEYTRMAASARSTGANFASPPTTGRLSEAGSITGFTPPTLDLNCVPTRSNQEDAPRSPATEHCSRTTEKP